MGAVACFVLICALFVGFFWVAAQILHAAATSSAGHAVEPAPGNLRPRYYRYGGGWTKVTVCRECGLRGLYADAHPVNPCIACGGQRAEAVGIWRREEGRWELREEANGD